MSPDTAGNGKARTARRKARRALLALAGAGALAAVPLAVETAAGATPAVNHGDPVVATASTPLPVRRALQTGGPVVVAFLLPGMTEDDLVGSRLAKLERSGKFNDTTFLIYRITNHSKLGDLPLLFNVTYTPAVAVVQGNDRLGNVWRGIVDEDIIAQSLLDARAAVPQPVSLPPLVGTPHGSAAGIALARRVNRAYVTVPGVTVSGTVRGLSGSLTFRLVRARSVAADGQIGPASVILNRTGVYAKVGGASCWTRSTSPKGMLRNDPAIPLRGVRFAKPVRSGADILLRTTDLRGQYGGKGSVTTFTIDPSTWRIVSVDEGSGGKATYTSLGSAPTIPTPDQVC